LAEEASTGISSFLYLPHSFFVAANGLENFESAMAFQYELTQRFTAEFCIRPFLERWPEATLARLRLWTNDPSEHVRRLVSEGTRPRLPWAGRLREFQKNPGPVLDLLERLKDDSSLYVRRSVANNLNDIGKDHPEVLIATARRWLVDATESRRWIIRRALRSLIKEGNPAAMALMGCRPSPTLRIEEASVTPSRVDRGGSVSLKFRVSNTGSRRAKVIIDFRVHYVKANGKTSPKVFKLSTVHIPAQSGLSLSKDFSLKDLTTRRHHPGEHHIEALLNGTAHPIGCFQLMH
jgi:3-methyladenine DNA glycosylase AlkC